MSEIAIDVHKRSDFGKGNSRRLRNQGLVPAVVYGAGKEPVSIQLDRKTLADLFRHGTTENTIFRLKLGATGQERHAMIRELQLDPIRRQVQHVDFQRILMDQKVKVHVPVELVGVAQGVKNEGGVLDFVTRQVEIECLPASIPDRLVLDVGELHIGQHLEARHLQLPEGVALSDPGRVIASVAHARTEAVEAPEGEQLIEAEREEPEVIRRGKVAEEEG